MNYKDRLISTYHRTHGINIDSDAESKVKYFRRYYKSYYKKFFVKSKTSEVLEVGCNKGYLLRILEEEGYSHITGIDMSDEDLTFARNVTSKSILINEDIFKYLKENPKKFDLIIMKAVLEHIDKDKILLLLENLRHSLNPSGILIVDVPNMDWLFATHERYMDFTHEVGFTKESLSQVVLNVFQDVEVFTAGNILNSHIGRMAHILAQKMVMAFFRVLDPEGNLTAWQHRNLIAICKKNK